MFFVKLLNVQINDRLSFECYPWENILMRLTEGRRQEREGGIDNNLEKQTLVQISVYLIQKHTKG